LDTIGARLKQARERKVLSQEDLSTLSGVTEATISRMENGKSGPTRPSTARKLADALGVEASWLLFGEQEAVGVKIAA
jgi:transcriptional regulator with XRE-family HTH domain